MPTEVVTLPDGKICDFIFLLSQRSRDQLLELRGVIRGYVDTHFKEEQKTGT